MILSRGSEYAIRLIFYLYERQPLDKYLRIKEVAKDLDVSYNQLAKVANTLMTNGVLVSSTGPTGGIDLNEGADEITLASVIEIFGDEKIFDTCMLGLYECSDENPCPIHTVWGRSRGEMRDMFFSKTLGALKAEAVLPLMHGKNVDH